jgi:hypothetical protein
VDHTSFGVGSDGKFYKMLEHKEWGKFRTLSDQEEREELSRSREIKENIYLLSGKLHDDKYGATRRSGGIKLVPPQFGTQNRTRKIEKKAWDRTMADHGVVDVNSQYYDTMTALADNQEATNTLRMRGDSLERRKPFPDTFLPADGGLNVSQRSEDRLQAAVLTMKAKYEQNLHVVEQLFDEKKYMERKIRLLEERLGERGAGAEEAEGRSYLEQQAEEDEYDTEDPRMGATYAVPPPAYEEVGAAVPGAGGVRPLLRSSYDPSGHFPSRSAHRASDGTAGRYSAAELAHSIGGERGEGRAPRPRSAPPRRQFPAEVEADNDGTAPEGAARRRRAERSLSAQRVSRSLSASSQRSGSAGGGISANLQADADR